MILLNENMFTAFPAVEDQSIDLLLTDFPYGTINKRNIWDNVIDLKLFWEVVDRICKPTAPIISTAANPLPLFLLPLTCVTSATPWCGRSLKLVVT